MEERSIVYKDQAELGRAEEERKKDVRNLSVEDFEIINQYFTNGYSKAAAYAAYKNGHKNKNSLTSSSSAFWRRPAVKAEVERRTSLILGEREELANELLMDLKYRIFHGVIGEKYTYANRQKDIELLIRISGIDKAPKFMNDIKPAFSGISDIVISIGGEDR